MNQVPDENLSEYKDKYYGVGFQFISQPIQFLIKDIVKSINQSKTISMDDYGAKLVSKHFNEPLQDALNEFPWRAHVKLLPSNDQRFLVP